MKIWPVWLVFLSACAGGETIVKENNPIEEKSNKIRVSSIRFYEDESFTKEDSDSKDSERIKKIVVTSLQEKLKAKSFIMVEGANESENYRLDIQAAHIVKLLVFHWIHAKVFVNQGGKLILEITSKERVYGSSEEEIRKVAEKMADEVVKILVEKLAPK